ncbi:hypothetical protein [Larkinella rosea]|uniref:Uncharacterized protein n=1 Tax=Larkinella rosea TaxID=2025312 RepID=A0A3P1BTU3_9BACT|nr:hypothetical protein [Larkinella rosea]RRB04540.1 hypothetical protein EHT25_13680 [Larkinella rosea]
MKIAFAIFFIELICISLFSCSKFGEPDSSSRFLGTYMIRRNTQLMDPSTGNRFYVEDTIILTIGKSNTVSEIHLFGQDSCTAIFNKDKFVINLHATKRKYGDIIKQPYEVTGIGSFSGDSIFYTENLGSGSYFGLRGTSQLIGVKQ